MKLPRKQSPLGEGYLYGRSSVELENMFLLYVLETTKSKPVKLETSNKMILPPTLSVLLIPFSIVSIRFEQVCCIYCAKYFYVCWLKKWNEHLVEPRLFIKNCNFKRLYWPPLSSSLSFQTIVRCEAKHNIKWELNLRSFGNEFKPLANSLNVSFLKCFINQ